MRRSVLSRRVRTAYGFAIAALAIFATAGALTSNSAAAPSGTAAANRQQSTQLISRAMGPSGQQAGGGLPNGSSTKPVISNDKRYARLIAFESEASNLVPGDINGVKDVFA